MKQNLFVGAYLPIDEKANGFTSLAKRMFGSRRLTFNS